MDNELRLGWVDGDSARAIVARGVPHDPWQSTTTTGLTIEVRLQSGRAVVFRDDRITFFTPK